MGVNGLTVGVEGYQIVGQPIVAILNARNDTNTKLPPQKLNTSYEQTSGTSHTGSTLAGKNITITSERNTGIIGSSIHATADTTITAKNLNAIASIDTKTGYAYNLDYGINSNVGYSFPFYADLRADAYAQGGAVGSASTHVNNASIQSANLTIHTTKTPINLSQAEENHKKIGNNLKKLGENIKKYLQAQKTGNKFQQTIALAGITSNAAIALNNIKKSIALDKQNLSAYVDNLLFGNVNLLGGNLKANNIKMNVAGDLNISSIQSHSASGRADIEAKTGSIISAPLLQPLEAEGKLQGNLSATIQEQAGIKADKVEITTNRNIGLTNAYISATNKDSSIKSHSMTKLDLKDVSLDIQQDVGVKGILTLDQWLIQGIIMGGFGDIKDNFNNRKIIPAFKKLSDIAHLKFGDNSSSLSGSITSRPSSISKDIKVEIGDDKREPKNIFRGEAQEAVKTQSIKFSHSNNEKFWTKK
ncbi:hypothetical protein CQA62_01350 [Helicobacter cholecystus]|uniref:Uncharacterized protein n=1 Tax=Helicobacter cholecystus TaxID=45498 RepID=A0A3D8IXU3_9HELI|nr:hypothetical protein CQA62_01350 [Helicobacter cholecystus]